MSLSTTSSIDITVHLNATEAEEFARSILRKLEAARKQQEKNPEMHWNRGSLKDDDDILAYYTVTATLTLAGITVVLEPDERHPGCSGYCHY